jgi:PST family polysaccharide transporter
MRKIYPAKILSNFFALGIVQGTNFLIPLLVMPFVIKRIGVESFGVTAVAQVIMIYLATVADYGFNLTATREISLNRDAGGNGILSKIFSTVLTTKIIISIFAFALLLVLVQVVPFFKAVAGIYLFGFTYVLGQSLLVSWFFQGMEKMKFITFSVLIARIIFVILVFLFIRKPDDAFLFLFFFGLGSVLAGIFSIYTALRIFNLRFLFPSWPDVMRELRNGWQIMISNIFINTYLYSNIFILRFFVNDLVVGYYSIAERIFFAIRQILGIFSQAIYPQICQVTKQSKKQTAAFFRNVYQPFLLLVCAGSLMVFFFSPEIISLFTSTESEIPAVTLRMLSLVPVIVCLNIPAYQILVSLDLKKSYLRILTMGALVNFIVNISFADLWGALGTAAAIIITEIFITIGLNTELYKNKLTDYLKWGRV